MSVMFAQMVGNLSDVNLYDLIFKEILKLPQCSGNATWGCINGVFAHDFIFSLFLPHLVLLIFLFIASKGIGHKGLETLLGIGVYIFIVYSGWYVLFANLTILWLVISVFIAGFYFFWGRIVHPTRSKELFKLGFDYAKKGADKRKLEEALVNDIAYLRRALANAKGDDRKPIAEQLTQKEMQLRELRRQ